MNLSKYTVSNSLIKRQHIELTPSIRDTTLYYQYPFKSNFFTIGNHRIHYLDEGSGPAIFLLHGNPTWSYYYRRLIPELAKHFRVIVPDHMGCGFSDKPQKYQYTLENHIQNVSALKVHLGITTFSLVVHDWGGAIGMGLVAHSPESLNKVVILNTAAFRSKNIPKRIQLCKVPILGEIIVRAFNGFAWPATFMAVEKKLEREVGKMYLLPYDSWSNRIAVHRFVADIPLEEDHPSYPTLMRVEKETEQLSQRKTPMLILWGGKDFCFDDSFYNEWCGRFPHAQHHYFANAGHYILEDEPEECSRHICQFLAIPSEQEVTGV